MSENEREESIESKQDSMAFRDFYPVNPPYGYVGIAIDEERQQLKYHTVEPNLTDEEIDLLDRIKSILIDRMNIPLDVLKDPDKMETYLRDEIQKIFRRF